VHQIKYSNPDKIFQQMELSCFFSAAACLVLYYSLGVYRMIFLAVATVCETEMFQKRLALEAKYNKSAWKLS